jgi:hypothetical protein
LYFSLPDADLLPASRDNSLEETELEKVKKLNTYPSGVGSEEL